MQLRRACPRRVGRGIKCGRHSEESCSAWFWRSHWWRRRAGATQTLGARDRNVDPESIPRGGTLRMAGTTDVDFMDPGAMYYTASFLLARGVHRQLLTY